MDNKVRCADFPTRYQLIPADGPNRHSTLKMAAHLPAPGNSTWDVGLTLSPKHSRRTRSMTREIVDVNVLGRRWPGGIFPPQRPETSSMTGVYSASPKYPGDPFQWPGKILPLKNKIDRLSQWTWRKTSLSNDLGKSGPTKDPGRPPLPAITVGAPPQITYGYL